MLDHSPHQPQDHKGEELRQDQSVLSIPTELVCFPLWVQNAISYLRYSTLYYRTGFVLGDSAQLEAMGVLWAGLRWARLSNGVQQIKRIKCIFDLRYFQPMVGLSGRNLSKSRTSWIWSQWQVGLLLPPWDRSHRKPQKSCQDLPGLLL